MLRSAIVTEVKAAGSFWKQFSIALLTAILAPLIIGAVIVAAAAYDRGMFSASSVSEGVTKTVPPFGIPEPPPAPRPNR